MKRGLDAVWQLSLEAWHTVTRWLLLVWLALVDFGQRLLYKPEVFREEYRLQRDVPMEAGSLETRGILSDECVVLHSLVVNGQERARYCFLAGKGGPVPLGKLKYLTIGVTRNKSIPRWRKPATPPELILIVRGSLICERDSMIPIAVEDRLERHHSIYLHQGV